MKKIGIKIIIGKKHLYYLTGLISLFFVVLVIAPGDYGEGNVFHESLLVNHMKAKSENTITVDNDNNLDVTGDLDVKGDTTASNLEVSGTYKFKKTLHRYYQASHNKCGDGQINTLGPWDICFLTRYKIRDVHAGSHDFDYNDAAASCHLWYVGSGDVDQVFNPEQQKPTWKLQSYTDDYCQKGGSKQGDVYCEAICMNFE